MESELDRYLGVAAGITTAILFAGTSLLFAESARRIGTVVLNAVRLTVAIVFLALTHRLSTGVWIPPILGGQVFYLALSGFVGLVIGDQALFKAFIDIGPRLSVLIQIACPLVATLFGWFALGETLRMSAWIGMLLIVGGVAWVVLEKPPVESVYSPNRRLSGIFFACVAVAGQTGGLLLSKQGIGHGWLPEAQHLSPQAATLIRMVFGGLSLTPFLLLNFVREHRRRAGGPSNKRIGSRPAGFAYGALAGFFAGYLAVWLSLVAADRLSLGIAQALISLSPIFVLPLAGIFEKERVSRRAVIGAIVAASGAGLLFLHPR